MKSALSGKNGSKDIGRPQVQGMKSENMWTVRTHRMQGADAHRLDMGGVLPEYRVFC